MFTATVALGALGENRSEAAIRAATTNATVVKKPKTFWARTMVECIAATAGLVWSGKQSAGLTGFGKQFGLTGSGR